MSEELNQDLGSSESFEAIPQKRKNKKLWIILAIVALVLLCACSVVIAALVIFGVMSFPGNLEPFLNLVGGLI